MWQLQLKGSYNEDTFYWKRTK